MAAVEYLLGHSERELRRLELQAGLFAPGTERILRAAGLSPGMSVLDVGTGVGDVAMLAAGIVGASGSVLGIDREASVLERARARAAEAGLAQLRFAQGTLDAPATERHFDAVIGRYVLLYQPDRAAFLRQAAGHARPGGLLVFIEPGFAEPDSVDDAPEGPWSRPPVPLFESSLSQIRYAFKLSGARGSTGAELVGLFDEAGLPEPDLVQEISTGGPRSPIVDWICLTLQSVTPLLRRHGIAPVEGSESDTFHDKVRGEALASHSQMRGAQLIGGWVRVP